MSLEALLARDRAISLVLLVLVAVLAWGYLLSGAGMDMSAWSMTRGAAPAAMPGMAMPAPAWSPARAGLMLVMWWSMMVAMMLPSAVPVILLVAALERRAAPGRAPFGRAAEFAGGYLLAWGAFSLLAVAAQAGLTHLGLIDATLHNNALWLSGGLLLAAGAWQLSPLKRACLRHCRSPLAFLTRARPGGRPGALRLGMEHGAYCLGCCWMLMALLFVGGIMSLYWIVGLTLYVIAEKLLPGGVRLGRAAGVVLLIAGIALLLRSGGLGSF